MKRFFKIIRWTIRFWGNSYCEVPKPNGKMQTLRIDLKTAYEVAKIMVQP